MLDWISDDSGSAAASDRSERGHGDDEDGGRRLSGFGEGAPQQVVDLLAEASSSSSSSGAEELEQACRHEFRKPTRPANRFRSARGRSGGMCALCVRLLLMHPLATAGWAGC